MEKNDSLSINRFKDLDITKLTKEEFIDFALAKLMNVIIQKLEVAIFNDRVFSRAKYDVMAEIWKTREELHSGKAVE